MRSLVVYKLRTPSIFVVKIPERKSGLAKTGPAGPAPTPM